MVDRTGQSSVEVAVGAAGNGGNFAFGPAAVKVSKGTKVVWEWNGKGGTHNVKATEGGGFDAPMVPPPLQNEGKFVVSLAEVTQWLAPKVMDMGIQIFPGSVPVYRGNTLVGGIGVSGRTRPGTS